MIAWLRLLPFGLLLIVYWQRLRPPGDLVGHDYYHYVPRALLGALHLRQNGLAVPHYTPSLCGGLPVFADPQSIFYSLPQLFTLVLDPVTAAHVATLVCLVLGYWACHRLLARHLGCRPGVAHLGALAFSANGFTFAHLFVGHVTHHAFALLAVLIVCARERRTAWLAMAAAYLVMSGSTHVVVVTAASFLLLLPWLWESRRSMAMAAALVLVICAGKIAAIALYAPHFVTHPIDRSLDPAWAQLLRYFWLNPGPMPEHVRFGYWQFGPWEYVGFVSRGVLALALLGAVLKRRQALVYAVLAALIVAIALGRLGNDLVPVLRNYHNPIKLLGALILPLILLAGVALERVVSGRRLPARTGWVAFALAGIVLIAEFDDGAAFFARHPTALAMPYDAAAMRKIVQGGSLREVTRAVDTVSADVAAVAHGLTSIRCYEPLFGYRWEKLGTTVKPGPVLQTIDGKLNLNHPGCLLYPDHFGCRPWDRVPAAQLEEATRFVQGYPAWGAPAWHRALIWLGFVMMLAIPLKKGWDHWSPRWRSLSRR